MIVHWFSCILLLSAAALWVTEEHNLSATRLGVASTAIGIAELIGEVLVIAIGDHISTLPAALSLL